jgi:hypothetical protein
LALSMLPIFLSARSRAYVFDLSLAFLRPDSILSSAHAVALVPGEAPAAIEVFVWLFKSFNFCVDFFMDCCRNSSRSCS